MFKKLIFTLIMFVLMCNFALAEENLTGKWEGNINILGKKLIIITNFLKEKNQLKGTIDIPQQGAKSLKLNNFKYKPPKLFFELEAGPSIAKFEGNVSNNEIKGSFIQNGLQGTFKLNRKEELKIKNNDINIGIASIEKEIVIINNEIQINGVLSIPKNCSLKCPTVIMINGSGAQDRNSDVFGFKIFEIISDHLIKNNIATFRYDDRGVGKSTGNVIDANSKDIAKDVLEMIATLKKEPQLKNTKIGLLGHSEGGVISTIVNSLSYDIKYNILLASPAIAGKELLFLQSKKIIELSKIPESEKQEKINFQKNFFKLVENNNYIEIDKLFRSTFKNSFANDSHLENYINKQISAVKSNWYQYFFKYDPKILLSEIEIPTLALFGDLDSQVPAEENSQALLKIFRESNLKNYQIKTFNKANHLFQEAKTGHPNEYSSLKKEFVNGFLTEISNWINNNS